MSTRHLRDAIVFLPLLILFGAPSFLLALFIAFTPVSEQFYRLDGNERNFIALSSDYISNFQAKENRLPTSLEFSQWIESQKCDCPRLVGAGVSLISSKYPNDLLKNLGQPLPNQYAIEFWNGDVSVLYPNWGNRPGEGYITDDEYFPFGSRAIAIIVFLSIPITLIFFWVKSARSAGKAPE